MFKTKMMIVFILAAFLTLGSSTVLAKVSADEAAKLKTELTPMGAEKAGNADGSIPAWTGKGVPVPAGYKGPGYHQPDPFPEDKPLYVITAQNVDQYADKLTDGLKAMFKAYPETFKMPVYQTRRTAIYPDWYVENTYQNALNCELTENGNAIGNAAAGVPFPIPKSGTEGIWNHMLRFRGVYRRSHGLQATPDLNGKYVDETVLLERYFPFYDPAKTGSDMNVITKVLQTAPPRIAGDQFLLHDYINPVKSPRNAWRYFAGQRRVRRAPVLAYDTPLPSGQGMRTMDDYDMFMGAPDRYEWKLVGKKEIIIPYNNFKLALPEYTYDDIVKPFHINPDLCRYELHRVWVLEANLKEGKRHVYSRRVKYLDEDSWAIAVNDRYDEKGTLWRCAISYLVLYWDVPTLFKTTEVHHDLMSRRYNVVPMLNEEPKTYEFHLKVPKDSHFNSSSLRRSGIR
ncbi:MAG: DUF1329 domain-containing protein [Deltaproteobacteria bacterium]|nr:DUF1329 domain-containing protein [Deltaproteobacteria bacterium]